MVAGGCFVQGSGKAFQVAPARPRSISQGAGYDLGRRGNPQAVRMGFSIKRFFAVPRIRRADRDEGWNTIQPVALSCETR